MAVNLSPVYGVAGQLFDNNGNPLAGGKIYTYAAGTTTPVATYTTSAGDIAHSNPIVLDGAGRVPTGEIWLTDGISYKFVVQDSANNLIGTYDNLVGINSNFVAYTNEQEIQTATAGQTVFNLATVTYQPGTNSLSVFVDGVNQYGPGAQYAYVETDQNTVTFVSGLHVGASVKFTTSQLNSSGSTDASLVTYDPPFTNSVVTNVEDKLAQTISVKDFGATGNGTTDDTAAIQAALNAGGGKAVYFPAGDYKLTSNVFIPNNTYVYGDGEGSRIFGDGTVGALLRGVWPCEYVTVDNLCLDGGKSAGTGPIVVCFYTSASIPQSGTKNQYITIRNCVIKNASAGIGIENGKYISVHDNIVYSMFYQLPGNPGAGNYGYGVVLNGCVRSSIMNNVIGVSGGLIERHAIYLPVFRDADINPTVLNFCEEMRIIGNHCQVNPDIDPFSSCIESWNYFDFLIDGNILIGGQRGINSTPEYVNGSRVLITNNIIKDNYVGIRNDRASLAVNANTLYFEEYLIDGNQIMPINTSAAVQGLQLEGIKKITFTNNYVRHSGANSFAFGYYDTINSIESDVILSANNTIQGFLQGFYLANVVKFYDDGTVFRLFTGGVLPYAQITNVQSKEMHPIISPYTELWDLTDPPLIASNWHGVQYFSQAVNKNVICIYDGVNTLWVDEAGWQVRGTTASRPNLKSAAGASATSFALGLPYGFKFYDTNVGAPIYWNGNDWFTSQQPAIPASGTTIQLNDFKTNYPNALGSYNAVSWNTDTSKPVFWNDLTGNWVYADGTPI